MTPTTSDPTTGYDESRGFGSAYDAARGAPYAPGYPGLAYAPPREEERAWAAVAHGGGLAGVLTSGLLGVVAPLVVLLTRGQHSPYVRRHAVQSLNFQLTLLTVGVVGAVAGVVVTLLTLGLALLVIVPAALAYFVFAVVVMALATVRSATGEDYAYPLSIPYVR